MADTNFFFKVLAELGYFKCFYILLFPPLTGGGGGFRLLVEIPLIFIVFETLPYGPNFLSIVNPDFSFEDFMRMAQQHFQCYRAKICVVVSVPKRNGMSLGLIISRHFFPFVTPLALKGDY